MRSKEHSVMYPVDMLKVPFIPANCSGFALKLRRPASKYLSPRRAAYIPACTKHFGKYGG